MIFKNIWKSWIGPTILNVTKFRCFCRSLEWRHPIDNGDTKLFICREIKEDVSIFSVSTVTADLVPSGSEDCKFAEHMNGLQSKKWSTSSAWNPPPGPFY